MAHDSAVQTSYFACAAQSQFLYAQENSLRQRAEEAGASGQSK